MLPNFCISADGTFDFYRERSTHNCHDTKKQGPRYDGTDQFDSSVYCSVDQAGRPDSSALWNVKHASEDLISQKMAFEDMVYATRTELARSASRGVKTLSDRYQLLYGPQVCGMIKGKIPKIDVCMLKAQISGAAPPVNLCAPSNNPANPERIKNKQDLLKAIYEISRIKRLIIYAKSDAHGYTTGENGWTRIVKLGLDKPLMARLQYLSKRFPEAYTNLDLGDHFWGVLENKLKTAGEVFNNIADQTANGIDALSGGRHQRPVDHADYFKASAVWDKIKAESDSFGRGSDAFWMDSELFPDQGSVSVCQEVPGCERESVCTESVQRKNFGSKSVDEKSKFLAVQNEQDEQAHATGAEFYGIPTCPYARNHIKNLSLSLANRINQLTEADLDVVLMPAYQNWSELLGDSLNQACGAGNSPMNDCTILSVSAKVNEKAFESAGFSRDARDAEILRKSLCQCPASPIIGNMPGMSEKDSEEAWKAAETFSNGSCGAANIIPPAKVVAAPVCIVAGGVLAADSTLAFLNNPTYRHRESLLMTAGADPQEVSAQQLMVNNTNNAHIAATALTAAATLIPGAAEAKVTRRIGAAKATDTSKLLLAEKEGAAVTAVSLPETLREQELLMDVEVQKIENPSIKARVLKIWEEFKSDSEISPDVKERKIKELKQRLTTCPKG